MNKHLLLSALMGLGVLAGASAAEAQQLRLDERGLRVVPQERERVIIERRDRPIRREISRREAIEIAEDNGIDEVDRVVSTDSEWRIVGEDRRGRELRVIIDRFNGRVIRRVRVS